MLGGKCKVQNIFELVKKPHWANAARMARSLPAANRWCAPQVGGEEHGWTIGGYHVPDLTLAKLVLRPRNPSSMMHKCLK